MKNGTKKGIFAKYCLVALFTILLGIVGQITGPAVPAAEAFVVPVGLTSGAEYGEWSARWWQWALSIPWGKNPVADTTGEHCAEGQVGNVWFLAGSFGSDPVERTCTVPKGKPLFFPLINVAVSDPFPNETILDLRMQALPFIDPTTSLSVTIDKLTLGTAILSKFRVQSPVFQVVIPQGAVQCIFVPGPPDPACFLFPAGPHPTVVSDGYWLFLSPLPVGTHTIKIKAVGFFNQDVTYTLIVK